MWPSLVGIRVFGVLLKIPLKEKFEIFIMNEEKKPCPLAQVNILFAQGQSLSPRANVRRQISLRWQGDNILGLNSVGGGYLSRASIFCFPYNIYGLSSYHTSGHFAEIIFELIYINSVFMLCLVLQYHGNPTRSEWLTRRLWEAV